MTQNEIKEKTMKDLGISEHRARTYAKMFKEKFGGNVMAITYTLATYTPDGGVRFSYIINEARYFLTIDGNNPYSVKKKEMSNK